MGEANEWKELHRQISTISSASMNNTNCLPNKSFFKVECNEDVSNKRGNECGDILKEATLKSVDLHAELLHQQKLPDYDILQRNLDRAHENMKAIIFSYFVNTQQQLSDSHEIERKKLLATHSNEVILLEKRVEELQQRLHKSNEIVTRNQNKHNHIIKALCARSMYLDRMWRGSCSSRSIFQCWKKHIQSRRRRAAVLHTKSYRNRTHTLRSSLNIWRNETLTSKSSRQNAEGRKRQMDDRIALMSEYQSQITALQNDLQVAREMADQAGGKQRQMEEDLRKIFLRGVSAMNIEALSLFRHQHTKKHIDGEDAQTPSSMNKNAERLVESDLRKPQGFDEVRAMRKCVNDEELSEDKVLESCLSRAELPVKKPVEHADMQLKLQKLIATSQEQLKQIQRQHKHIAPSSDRHISSDTMRKLNMSRGPHAATCQDPSQRLDSKHS